jgi:hypothetical protein
MTNLPFERREKANLSFLTIIKRSRDYGVYLEVYFKARILILRIQVIISLINIKIQLKLEQRRLASSIKPSTTALYKKRKSLKERGLLPSLKSSLISRRTSRWRIRESLTWHMIQLPSRK